MATYGNRLEVAEPKSWSEGSFDGGDIERNRIDFTFRSQRQSCSAAQGRRIGIGCKSGSLQCLLAGICSALYQIVDWIDNTNVIDVCDR